MPGRSHRVTPASAPFTRAPDRAPADTAASLPFLRRYLEHAPAASAVVSGAAHGLVFANAAFRGMTLETKGNTNVGKPIAEALPAEARVDLTALLDRVRRDGVALHNARVGLTSGGAAPGSGVRWLCDVWPVVADAGRLDYLVVAVRVASRGDGVRARQREITERLLFTALREREMAQRADNSRARAVFLAEASRRLGASFELETVCAAIARVALPKAGSWCIVDVVEPNGSWRRLPIAHPDPTKEALVRELDGHWSPAPGDPIGAPLITQSTVPTTVVADTETVLASAAHGVENLRILHALDIGPLLVVPLVAHDRLRGAITFVSPSGAAPYSSDDVLLAEDLALRCASLLDGARLYDDARLAQIEADAALALADAARKDAESANQVKTSFLTAMSHELRTPLNAILGYTEFLSMGLRGPVSADQEDALGRIRQASTHLLGLINDVLNIAKLRALQVSFLAADFLVSEVLDGAGAMVEPQAVAKGLAFVRTPGSPTLTVHADREKVLQILLNLLSNAIKFTDPGGRVTLAATSCDRRRRAVDAAATSAYPTPPAVQLTVSDTGRGIAAEQLKTIFEPFVQVGRRLVGTEEGTGLGLAISRDLARGMGGDLTVESTLGVGSTFSLILPCVAQG